MFKFGFEKEYFIFTNSSCETMAIPADHGLPYDDGGLLAETRSEPQPNPIDAIYNLEGWCLRLRRMVKSKGLVMSDFPYNVTPQAMIDQLRRRFAKGLVGAVNLYGFSRHNANRRLALAGLHISITKQQTIFSTNGRVIDKVNVIWDYASLVRRLDKQFREEIKRAKRKPGFYELKVDGRFEYKSLPADVNLMKVLEQLEEHFDVR